ncbi:LuxR C-terminal-related transcriptional regulator [Blautia schinkii]|nr:LuxR C-terminal-related transcriptional regulator [Blautia schinkii]
MYHKSFYFPKKLLHNLSPILEAPLSLITAGAGFGKTTAISHYLKTHAPSQCKIRWYTCFDSLQHQIWSDMCSLLAIADSVIAEQLRSLDYPTPDNLGYLSLLSDDLSCETETWLVIDNYQKCGFTSPGQVLNALSLHHCPRLHLIFISHPLEYETRLALSNPRIYHVDQEAFLFCPQDIRQLFSKNGVKLSEEETQYLSRATEGWIAPLQLHLSNYQNGHKPGVELKINELIEQIFWNPLEPEQKDFFLMLSLLDTFTPKQTAILLNQDSTPEKLWRSIRSNAFVYPIGREYTLHSLLREFLSEKFFQQSPSFYRETIRRVACACLSQNKNLEAFLHFADIKEDSMALATPLTSQELAELIKTKALLLESMIERCSDELLLKHWDFLPGVTIKASLLRQLSLARLCFRRLENLTVRLLHAPGLSDAALSEHSDGPTASFAHSDGSTASSTHSDDSTASSVYSDGCTASSAHSDGCTASSARSDKSGRKMRDTKLLNNNLLAALELIRSFQAYNNVTQMCLHHQAALEHLENPENFYLTNDPWTFCIPSPVYMFWRESGKLQETCRRVTLGIPNYARLSGGKGIGAPETMQSECLLLSGNFENAEIMAHRASYIAAQAGQDSLCFASSLTLCRVALLNQHTPTFLRLFNDIQQKAFSGKEFFCLTMSEVCQAFLYMTLNLETKIPSWFGDPQAITQHLYPISVPYAKIILSRLLRLENPLCFLGVADEFEAEAKSFHTLLPCIYFKLEQACAYIQLNKRLQALQHVHEALSLALSDQVYLPFAEYYNELCEVYADLEEVYMKPDESCSKLQSFFMDPDENSTDTIFAAELPVDVETLTNNLKSIKSLGRKMLLGAAEIRAALCPGSSPLTPREREIALLAKNRLSNQEIADKLCISPATVKNTLYKIYGKLNVHGKAGLREVEF